MWRQIPDTYGISVLGRVCQFLLVRKGNSHSIIQQASNVSISSKVADVAAAATPLRSMAFKLHSVILKIALIVLNSLAIGRLERLAATAVCVLPAAQTNYGKRPDK